MLLRMNRISVLLVVLSLTPFANAETITGRVVKVTDGDTITVLVDRAQRRIRLSEIDAPERSQPFGNRARQALAGLVANRVVVVEVTDTDRYGRLIGRITVDVEDVNRQMVVNGFAWVYRQYMTDRSLLEDEARARDGGVGLWSDPHPVPPWEWRRGARQAIPRAKSPGQAECGSKRTCGQMLSCAEAMWYFRECGLSRLDGDQDGVPCEQLCR